MRAAPALDANLDPARPERVLIMMLHALAGLVWGAWWVLSGSAVAPGAAHAPPALPLMLAIGAGGLGAVLARHALPMPAGRLAWTGQAWVLRQPTDQALHRVVVTIDLGNWLLLRLHRRAGGPALWRVARQRSAGASWHALRVALQAHGGPVVADGTLASGRMP